METQEPQVQEVDYVEAAKEIFGDNISEQSIPDWGQPDAKDFITLKGGQYLPARRRIIWMRGKPVTHPDWTIQTYEREVVIGEFDGRRVRGGYARFYCEVRDESGRVIATGTKTEYSERFPDYAEKAETGAIARALAVAGYGTESALDIDEGVDADRIADAPVQRPINISSSSVPDLQVGGRQRTSTAVQLQEISRLAKDIGWDRKEFIDYVTGATGKPIISDPAGAEVDLLTAERADYNRYVMAFLQGLEFEEAATLIRSLVHARETK